MDILALSHLIPYPPILGVLQRTYNIYRGLGARHNLDMVALNQKSIIDNDEGFETACKEVQSFCRHFRGYKNTNEKSSLRWYGIHLLNLLSGYPYSWGRFNTPEFRSGIEELVSNNAYDFIYFDTVSLAPFYNLVSAGNLIMHHHNIESELLFRRASEMSPGPVKWYFREQAKRIRKLEDYSLEKFPLHLCVSERDAEQLRVRSSRTKIEVVENGTDTEFFSPLEVPQEDSVVFAGNMTWAPNDQGLCYFLENIYPLLEPLKVTLIGKGASSRLQSLASKFPEVTLTGFVDDVRPFIARAKVYIVPIIVGGGSRLKILDAMASGKAVVSTSTGAEGLSVTDGENIFIEDSPEAFAEKIKELIDNDLLRAQVQTRAREFVIANYGWEKIVSDFEGHLRNF